MQDLTSGKVTVTATGTRVKEIIEDLEKLYPGLRERLVRGDRLRPDVAVTVDGELAALGLFQPVNDSSEVHFLPAIAGG
jgi:molybdopterin converting factor small subunit